VGIAAGLVLLGGAIWALFGQSPQAAIEVTGRPSLKVNRETIDLGNQKLDNTVQAAFELTNVGDQPLRFTLKSWRDVDRPPRPSARWSYTPAKLPCFRCSL